MFRAEIQVKRILIMEIGPRKIWKYGIKGLLVIYFDLFWPFQSVLTFVLPAYQVNKHYKMMTFVHYIKSYISSGFHPLYNSSIEKQASYYNNPVLLVPTGSAVQRAARRDKPSMWTSLTYEEEVIIHSMDKIRGLLFYGIVCVSSGGEDTRYGGLNGHRLPAVRLR